MGTPSFAHWACLVDFFVCGLGEVLLAKLLDGEKKYLLTPSCKKQSRCDCDVWYCWLGYCLSPIDLGIVTRLDVLFLLANEPPWLCDSFFAQDSERIAPS